MNEKAYTRLSVCFQRAEINVKSTKRKKNATTVTHRLQTNDKFGNVANTHRAQFSVHKRGNIICDPKESLRVCVYAFGAYV